MEINLKNVELYNCCNGKLNLIDLGNVELVFSYNSLIGLNYGSYFILDNYYSNFSNTTKKHISYNCNDIYHKEKIIKVNSNDFDKLINENLKDLEFIIKNYENHLKYLKYLKDMQYTINNKIKDIHNINFELSLNLPLKIIKTEKENLTNVIKVKEYFKVNSITFELVKTFSKKDKKLTNCKIYNITENSIRIIY